jgi:hypothetical protein
MRDFTTISLDIYQIRSLRDFTVLLGKEVNTTMKQLGVKNMPLLRESDVSGDGENDDSLSFRLEEIFENLETSPRPIILTIDEFQRVYDFPEKGAAANLKSYIQQSRSTRFVISGSEDLIKGNQNVKPSKSIFSSNDAFSLSFSMLYPSPVPLADYTYFVTFHFRNGGFDITPDAVEEVYNTFGGSLWHMQHIMSAMYNRAQKGSVCTAHMVKTAITDTLLTLQHTYSELLFRIPPKQKELLKAIASEGFAKNITSGAFVKKYDLTSQSSVQAALKGLLEKDYVKRIPPSDVNSTIFTVTDLFLAKFINN